MLKRNRADWDRILHRIAKCQRRIAAGYTKTHLSPKPNVEQGWIETEPQKLLRLLDALFIKEPYPMSEDYTCCCGIYVHPSRRNPKATHIPDCEFAQPNHSPSGSVASAASQKNDLPCTYCGSPSCTDYKCDERLRTVE